MSNQHHGTKGVKPSTTALTVYLWDDLYICKKIEAKKGKCHGQHTISTITISHNLRYHGLFCTFPSAYGHHVLLPLCGTRKCDHLTV